MTARERAENIAAEIGSRDYYVDCDWETAVCTIEAALIEAVREERERCAQIADTQAERCGASQRTDPVLRAEAIGGQLEALYIAERIRAIDGEKAKE